MFALIPAFLLSTFVSAAPAASAAAPSATLPTVNTALALPGSVSISQFQAAAASRFAYPTVMDSNWFCNGTNLIVFSSDYATPNNLPIGKSSPEWVTSDDFLQITYDANGKNVSSFTQASVAALNTSALLIRFQDQTCPPNSTVSLVVYSQACRKGSTPVGLNNQCIFAASNAFAFTKIDSGVGRLAASSVLVLATALVALIV